MGEFVAGLYLDNYVRKFLYFMHASTISTITQFKPAQRVCVLAGSMGGPTGMRRFLRSLPPGLPVAFIIVQHISPDAISLLCEYISRSTAMRVTVATQGHTLCHGEVVVMPTDKLLVVDASLSIGLVDSSNEIHTPVDSVMGVVAERFGACVGAIIFSGIGDDGVAGCRLISKRGGEVWTQSDESCRFGSLPLYVQGDCQVAYSSTPENLAARLVSEFVREKKNS